MQRLCSFLICTMTLTLWVVAATPSTAAASDLETVTAALAQNQVYVEEGAFVGEEGILNAAVQKASANDLNLYIVALANETSGLKAEAIQEAIGSSTVLLFTPKLFDFDSIEVCKARFDEARANADTAITTGGVDEAALGFVDALVALPESTCESDTSTGSDGLPWWTWLLLFVAAVVFLFFLWSVWGQFAAKKRREVEQVEFDNRRRILQEWAGTLRAPITELQVPVAQSKSSSLAAMFNDALKVARESDGDLQNATAVTDLDRAEIRIARAHMQVRDVRKALDR